jgi:AraC-like DNA-binding protein
MPSLYDELFQSRRIVDDAGLSHSAAFDALPRWLPSVGCFVQANNAHCASTLSSETVVNPSIMISLVLKGVGEGGSWGEGASLRYGDNTLVVLAMRKPTRWWGQVPRGAHLRAVGLAFPLTSLERLNLRDEFDGLFRAAGADVLTATLKASPRLLAIAGEMLSPPLKGSLAGLLLGAHSAEILAHSMAALASGGMSAIKVDERIRLQSVCEAIDANLQRNWSLTEIAKETGLSKRALNTKFRDAFGTTVFDYLKRRRLEFAREALVHQRLSVSEVAYCVGYRSPANFATAFRRHFGYAPSRCRTQSLAV